MIEPLLPADVQHLSLRPNSYFTRHSLTEHLMLHPNFAWRNTLHEYIIGGFWKGRDDIGEIMELGGPARIPLRVFHGTSGRREQSSWRERRGELMNGIADSYQAHGAHLVLLSEREGERAAPLYEEQGWRAVEQIIYYRKSDVVMPRGAGTLRVERLKQRDISQLMDMERDAFPWMWCYSLDEWLNITLMPGVETFVAYAGDDVVGYETHTIRNERGHLDRLGIRRAAQGHGYGSELLAWSVHRLANLGARTIGLSTQWNNIRSQQLYEKYGFARLPGTTTFYGKALTQEAEDRLRADDTRPPGTTAPGTPSRQER